MIDPLAYVRAAMTLTGAIVMGSAFLLWYVRETLAKPSGTRWRRRVMGMVLIAAALGVLATAGVVIGTAANAAGADHIFAFDAEAVRVFVSQTWSGGILLTAFCCALATFAAAGLAFLLRERIRAADVLTVVAADFAGLGLAVIAFASHPTTLDPQWFGLGLSIVHRLALGLWLGGLPALVLLLGTGTVAGETRHLAVTILTRFSRVAIAAMIVLIASGLVLTWYIVGNFSSLIGTIYGRLLIAKLLALVGVLVIAHGLRKHLLPKLEADPSATVFASYGKRVKVETGLAVLILALASVMADRAPPEHENIVWPLPFRFSIEATWGMPWHPTMVIGGLILALVGLGLVVLASRPSRMSPRFSAKPGLAVGAAAIVAGGVLALPALSVPAFPDSYLVPEVAFSAESIAHGLDEYENNCTLCHGVSGRGDGQMAFVLPVPPADLTAPHTALHTPGDMFWWLTNGIPQSAMPAFAETLSTDDRWDIINFLRAFSVGHQARVLSPRIVADQAWLGPPDLPVIDETGKEIRLRDYRTKSAVLLVLASGAKDKARVEQLLAARGKLADLGVEIVLIAPGGEAALLRDEATGKIPLVDASAAAATFSLYTRSLGNAKADRVRVQDTPAEFLIDRSGYLRARWLATEETGAERWSDLGVLERQLALLAKEPLRPPPPDHGH